MEYKDVGGIEDEFNDENSYGRPCMGTSSQHDKVVYMVGLRLVHTSQQNCIVPKYKIYGHWAKIPTMKDHPIPLERDQIMSHGLVLPTRMNVGSHVTMKKCVLIQQ